MANLILLFNHSLTPEQEDDARRSLKVEHIVPAPEAIQAMWCRIPAERKQLRGYLEPIAEWIQQNTNPGDYILIQGDFGASYMMVRFAAERQLIPVYATTEREVVEEKLDNGTIQAVHRFRHIIFRRYGN